MINSELITGEGNGITLRQIRLTSGYGWGGGKLYTSHIPEIGSLHGRKKKMKKIIIYFRGEGGANR